MPKVKSEFEELEKLLKQGLDPRKTKRLERNATNWFLDKVKNQSAWKSKYQTWDGSKERKEFGPEEYMRGKKGIQSIPVAGQMFVYWYDAKTKDKLPYWDRFPMVLPIEMYEDGWLGLNIHYLPPFLRARLLGLIMATMRSQKLSREAKARINYARIKATASLAIAKPCIKRYLASHVVSKIVRVPPSEWENAVMLPVDMFVKQRREKVWRDSVDAIKGRK